MEWYFDNYYNKGYKAGLVAKFIIPLDISDLPAGWYIINVTSTSSRRRWIQKLIVEK